MGSWSCPSRRTSGFFRATGGKSISQRAHADQECERDKTCREDPEVQRQQQAERARKSEFVVQEMEDELQDDEYAHML